MRLLVALNLKNGHMMHVVANVASKKEAKQWAEQSSVRLFGDSELHVTNKATIKSCESWKQDRHCYYQDGNKEYYVAFFMDNVTQLIRINAGGVKSAYNNVKVKYGIKENINALIYKVNQPNNSAEREKKEKAKLSAIQSAKELIKDNNKLNLVFTKASEKVSHIPVLNISYAETYTMFSMVTDYCNSKYNNLDINKILGIVGCTLYFLSPEDIKIDVNSGLEELDDVTVFAWILKQSREDIIQYSRWASCGCMGM